MATLSQIEAIGALLKDEKRPLKERFRALFTLRNLGGETAISLIADCFSDPSALLKHELAYCLGQMGDSYAIPILVDILKDTRQEPMVRHEAGEALGAIGDAEILDIMEEYSQDPITEVAETCQLAVKRIKWLNNEANKEKMLSSKCFTSVDPAPPSTVTDLGALEETLLDESVCLYNRYRAMFSLRNVNTPESAKVLAKGFKASSALFRHEIAYVLGQMSYDSVVTDLAVVLQDFSENEMVRHEAAEALGAIATDEAVKVLHNYVTDSVKVVSESCEIALDMSDYTNSPEFQYADGLLKIQDDKVEP